MFSKMTNRLDILIKNSRKLNDLCRICLTENCPDFTSLFEVHNSISISERVMLCARIEIRNDDGLPGFICQPCIAELDTADHFRIKCENSDSLLKKFYLESIVKQESIEIPDYFSEEKSTEDPQIKEENGAADSDGMSASAGEQRESPPLKVFKLKKKKKIKTTKSNSQRDIKFKTETNLAVKKEELENDSMDIRENGVNDDSVSRNKTKYSCHLCGKPLSSKSSVEHHIARMHSGGARPTNVTGFGAERRFHCAECPYSTKYSQSLKYHASVHSGERPYRCASCPRSFTQPGSLSCHLKTHSSKMYFTCAQCGKQFKYKETYETHKSVHSELKKFTCSICNKGLKSKKTLEGHMNRHYNIRNFSCETCGKTFVTRVELVNHSRQHTAEKKFKCNYCDFSTHLKKGLDSHLRRHSGERPFKCDECGMACYTRGELKCHMRKHTKEKNYSCPVCELQFIHSSSVNKHMLKTHGIKYRRNDNLDRRIIK